MDLLKYIQLVDSRPCPSRNETKRTATIWLVVINLPRRTSQLVKSKLGVDAFATQAKAKILGVRKVEFDTGSGMVRITLDGERVKRAQRSDETRDAFGNQIAHDFDLLLFGIIG